MYCIVFYRLSMASYIYIYIYIQGGTERERERERESCICGFIVRGFVGLRKIQILACSPGWEFLDLGIRVYGYCCFTYNQVLRSTNIISLHLDLLYCILKQFVVRAARRVVQGRLCAGIVRKVVRWACAHGCARGCALQSCAAFSH